MKYFCLICTTMIGIIQLAQSYSTANTSPVQVVLTYCTYYANKAYVSKMSTPRKPINRTTSLTSADVYFWPNVSLQSPLYVHFHCYKKFATQYKPHLINLKFELCDVLKFQNHPLYRAFAVIGTESNFLDPCPYKGHRFVGPYLTKYGHVPLVPTGIWRIDINLTRGLDEHILMLRSYYEIKVKGITDEF